MKVVVGKVSDFANGDRKIIDVNGKSIGVFRVDDQFYAIRNRCPHQFGPLCVGDARAAGGLRRPRRRADGRRPAADRLPLARLGVRPRDRPVVHGPGPRQHGGALLRRDRPARPREHRRGEPAGPDGRIPGPYVAETMPVSVEQDYVVVEDSPARQKEASA